MKNNQVIIVFLLFFQMIFWKSTSLQANSLNAYLGLTKYEQLNEPVIHASFVADYTVEKYGKFETTLELEATYNNPYDFDQIRVWAVFTAPSGAQKTVDGFFMRDYNLNTSNGSLTPVGAGAFRVRFSPDELGEWSLQVKVSDTEGTASFDIQTFNCVEITSTENKGFVRTGNTNYLEFDNGEQLILIGENMGWHNSNAYLNYQEWVNKLYENGGNFIRIWHAHWGLGIEWKNGWQGFEGLRRYKERNLFYQDWLYDFCAEKGIYVMVALQHHGQVSSTVNPNWHNNPHNVVNGGTCQNTWDFFTDSTARAHTRNRLRYLVARYGYSRAVQSWELFNEVNWTDDFYTHIQKVRDWHAEMGAYLKEIDPYQHLISTSYADADQDPEVWNNPDYDFTQTYFYINSPNLERALVGVIRDYIRDFGKPSLTGEFGLGSSPTLANGDPDGIHIHNALWAPVFGGGMGTGMTWWWDNYIHPRDLYYHFAPVRTVVDQMPFLEADLQPAVSYVTGAPGDLVLTPTLVWGGIGEGNIIVDENGETNPIHPRLSSYLYGSEWNTAFRSPPSFSVNYPSAGEFSVTTGNLTGDSPKISISINGDLVLNTAAETNTTYTVLITPGPKLIKVDNLGSDWITIESYRLDNMGSCVDSYVLTAADNQKAAGWVLNSNYNHVNMVAGNVPEEVKGSELVVEAFADGDYYVKWYDCLTGEMRQTSTVSATNNTLRIPIPDLQWDMAFRVDDEPVVVDNEEVVVLDKLDIFPNPAKVGAEIYIQTDNTTFNNSKILISDPTGRLVHQTSLADGRFQLPPQLASGFYWVSVQQDNVLGTKGIFVGK